MQQTLVKNKNVLTANVDGVTLEKHKHKQRPWAVTSLISYVDAAEPITITRHV